MEILVSGTGPVFRGTLFKLNQKNANRDGLESKLYLNLCSPNMKITLNPKVAGLIKLEVRQANKGRRITRRELALGRIVKLKPDDLVNEVLWCAFRRGDKSKHYLS